MSISSLGRAIVAPSLREPVSPLSNARSQANTAAQNELKPTQVAPEVVSASGGRTQTEPERSPAQQQVNQQKDQPSRVRESADQMAEMLHRNNFELTPSGPLSRPDFKVIDQVNNIDFERAIPPQALRDRIYKLREDFIADLSQDRISFDSASPLGRRVLVIKESLNETEFVRHIPASYNDERVAYLSSFASERGFDFEATA
jgi:hypothetical protein